MLDQYHNDKKNRSVIPILLIGVAGATAFGASTMITVFLPYTEHTLKLPIVLGNHIFSIWLSIFFAIRIFGGYLGQKYFGYYWAISIGLFIAFLGEIIFFIGTLPIFYIGLVLVSLGGGLYGANIGALFTEHFAENNPPRSRAFVIYYVVMNLGAFCGDFSSQFFIKVFGYRWIFVFGAIPLFIGFLLFLLLARHQLVIRKQPILNYIVMLTYVLLGLPLGLWLLHHIGSFDSMLVLLFIGSLVYFMFKTYRVSQLQYRNTMLYALFIFFLLTYWGIYMLFPSVVEIYIEHHIAVDLFGKRLQPSTVASLSPFFLVVFGSFFALVKNWQDEPVVIKNKMVIGFIILALGFLTLLISQYFTTSPYLFLFIIIISYAFYALSEILIGPMGYAMVGILIPVDMVAIMMGFFYLTRSVAGIFTDQLTPIATSFGTKIGFMSYTLLAMIAALALWLLFFLLKGKKYHEA